MAQIIRSCERKGCTGDHWQDIRGLDSKGIEAGGIQVNIIFEFDDYTNWTNYIYKNGELKRR